VKVNNVDDRIKCPLHGGCLDGDNNIESIKSEYLKYDKQCE
jgi:hypothetical protein